jgi:c-di-GMP-binding flagellar brake protein YcgR
MIVTDGVESKLKKIHKSKIFLSLIQSAKEKAESIIVWRLIGHRKLTSQIKISSLNRVNQQMKIDLVDGDERGFAAVVSSIEKINFYIASSSILFQCQVKEVVDSKKIIVFLPSFVAQVEKRKSTRIDTSDLLNVRVQFSKRINPILSASRFFSKTPLDIGLGGMALLVSRSDCKCFFRGELIKNLEIVLDGQKILVDSEVVSVSEYGHYDDTYSKQKTFKIGLRFKNLEKKDLESLSNFIFRHSKPPIAI